MRSASSASRARRRRVGSASPTLGCCRRSARTSASRSQNARLYLETQRRASEMAALAELGREIGALLDLDPILERIAERARQLLAADTSAVFLERDGAFVPVVARRRLRSGAHGRLDHRRRGDHRRPRDPGRGRVRQRRARAIPRSRPHPGDRARTRGTADGAPLSRGARHRRDGRLAHARRPTRSPSRTSNFLVGLSQQAAIAIENARCSPRRKRRSSRPKRRTRRRAHSWRR